MKYEVRMWKCYNIVVIDEDGNEIESDYVFCNRKEYAKARADELLKEVKERRNEK